MQEINLRNNGADVWTVELKTGVFEWSETVPVNGAKTLFAESVKVGTDWEEIPTAAQYVRTGEVVKIPTTADAVFLAAYMILGALCALELFNLASPFRK